MTDKPKTPRAMVLVPREPTEAMFQAFLDGRGRFRKSSYRDGLREAIAIGTAEQPPALVGEPDRLTEQEIWEIDQDVTMQIDFAQGIESKVRSLYRAHVAQLQAEVERLNDQLSSEQDRVMATIGQYAKFEARTADLEGLLRMFADNSDDSDVVELSRNALAEGKEHE